MGRPSRCVWPALAVLATCAVQAAAAAPAPDAFKVDRVALFDVATAGKRLAVVGERGLVFTSDDRGGVWQAVATPVTRSLTAIAFADEHVGVAVGHGGTLIRTVDGGRSWSALTVDAAGRDSLLGVVHLGGGRFVAHGAYGLYLESADAGRQWVRRRIIAEDFDRHIAKIVTVRGDLLLVGESGTLARSADQGGHWQRIDSPYPGSFFGALVTPQGAVLAFGMRGHVYRSANGGGTWDKIELGTALAINGGRVLDDGRIVLVGNRGLLATSRDDGRRFDSVVAGEGSLSQVFAGAGGGLYVVGERGVSRVAPPSAVR